MYNKVTKLKKFTLLLVALTGLFAANQAFAVQGGNCSLNGDGEITDDTSSNARAVCFPDFQNARVTFHSILVCPSLPTLSTYKTICTPLFDSVEGIKVSIDANEDFPLPSTGPMSVSTGSYSHMAMVIDTKIDHKAVVTFSSARQGSGATSGKTCWTDSSLEAFKTGFNANYSNVVCGDADDADPTYSVDNSHKCSGGSGSTRENTVDWRVDAGTGAERANYWVQSDRETLQVFTNTCPSGPVSAIGETAFEVTPAQINFQKLATPLVITPSTSSIEFKLDKTGAGQIKQVRNGQGNCTFSGGCVTILRSRAPEFTITAR